MDIKQQFHPEITIISGVRNIGKTNLCLLLIETLQKAGKDIKGIVSPGIYKHDRKVGIAVRDIASGKEREMAVFSPGWDPQRPEREWLFKMEVVRWANQQLKKAVPADYLLIDELGYLEFEEHRGWTNGLKILSGGLYKHAFVVIRPDLLVIAKERLHYKKKYLVEENTDLGELCKKLLAQSLNKA